MSNDPKRMIESQPVLNRLLAIEEYSLPRYLLHAPPWACQGEEALLDLLRRIAEEQGEDAVRIGGLLVRRHGFAEASVFPSLHGVQRPGAGLPHSPTDRTPAADDRRDRPVRPATQRRPGGEAD